MNTVLGEYGVRAPSSAGVYATRDTNPERWYPRDSTGGVHKFDDLPEQYRGNINSEPPLDRRNRQAPALSAQDISDIVAFLRIPTDGYCQLSGQRRQADRGHWQASF